MSSEEKWKLSIVIPAYNEENAIASIIERCLAERDHIIRETPVSQVEVIVVNDGSRDATPEIARRYTEIALIDCKRNRGYGAAIKSGFEQASGTIVGFLDADGTCDPHYFIPMCNKLISENADIVIGSRMTPESKMPRVRKIGNLFFAGLINIIGHSNITDSASGMRVIKKESLSKIYPLPDGLHFTPAMSCRAVLDPDIRIVEIPMRYEERIGESKLGVLHDGARFLKTIIDIALVYEPFKFFGLVGSALFLIGFGYGLYPVFYYLKFRMIPDYMIYRLITVTVCIVSSFTSFTVGIISCEVTGLLRNRGAGRQRLKALVYDMLSQKKLICFGIAAGLGGILLNYQTIAEYLSTGTIHVHWVYIVTGAFLVLVGLQAFALGLLRRILFLLREARGTPQAS